jgi:hypothetical protein
LPPAGSARPTVSARPAASSLTGLDDAALRITELGAADRAGLTESDAADAAVAAMP